MKAGGVVPADTGGKIRSYRILKELARRHSVTLFTFYGRHADDRHPTLDGFEEVVAVPVPIPPARTFRDYLSYARLIFASHPYSMEKYYGFPEIRRRLAELLARRSFDAIVCDFVYPAGFLDWSLPCPKILFTHNVEAQIWERHFKVAKNLVWKGVYWMEWRALTRAERHYIQLADYVLTVSDQDREFFSRYVSGDRIATIPTGVDIEYFRPSAESEEPRSMVFTGSMDWMPNEDGIRNFVSETLPRIYADIPEARLWIVGRRPGKRVQSLAGPGVYVTGSVEDIRPYVQRANVYIVPLRCGSGTRIKIFEAMAMGKAVVSTTIGAEGLPVTHGKNILIADDPGEFAKCVTLLMRDPALAARLGKAARALVESNFSWASVAACFDPILDGLVARPGA